MQKFDLIVIGIGLVSSAFTLKAAEPVPSDSYSPSESGAVATGASAPTAEQQAQYDSWPPDRQVTFDSWGADTQAYFWSLSPPRQELFWQLGEEDRAAMLTMEPVEREEAWQMLEARMAAPGAP